MLSPITRILTYLTAALAVAAGSGLFFAPEQIAPVFAWNVTPFMGMTIGAWCLGNAVVAFLSARRWEWAVIYPSMIYLWLFGALELIVLLTFRDKVVAAHPVALVYLAMIAAHVLLTIVGVIDWLRLRPTIPTPPQHYGGLTYGLSWVFAIVVSGLGLYGLFAPMGSVGTNGGIFPEIMTPFTLRAFGAFYLALGLAAVPLTLMRGKDTLLFHAAANYPLLLLITLAIIPYFGLFHLADAPGGLIYIGAYVIVGIVIGVILVLNQDRVRRVMLPAS